MQTIKTYRGGCSLEGSLKIRLRSMLFEREVIVRAGILSGSLQYITLKFHPERTESISGICCRKSCISDLSRLIRTQAMKHMWEAAFEMLSLFGDVARSVGKSLSFVYDEEEEAGIEQYMRQVRKAWKEES